jgi:hypothetical protein
MAINETLAKKLTTSVKNKMSPVGDVLFPADFPIHGKEVAPEYKAGYDEKYKAQVWYSDPSHLYFALLSNNIKFPIISVTTLIHLVSTPFDSYMMSNRCAGKKDYETKCLDKSNWNNLSKKEKQKRILFAWEINNKQATEYGTYVHFIMESLIVWPELSNDETQDIAFHKYRNRFNISSKFAEDVYVNIILKYREKGIELISEPLLWSLDLLLAGQADLVGLDHHNKVIYILDYKTNSDKPGTKKIYNSMQPPLQEYDDGDLVHYSIQLCIYQYLVWLRYPDYSLGINTLIWLNRETGNSELIFINPSDWKIAIHDLLLPHLREAKKDLINTYKAYLPEEEFI